MVDGLGGFFKSNIAFVLFLILILLILSDD